MALEKSALTAPTQSPGCGRGKTVWMCINPDDDTSNGTPGTNPGAYGSGRALTDSNFGGGCH